MAIWIRCDDSGRTSLCAPAPIEVTINGEEHTSNISRATFEKLNGPVRRVRAHPC